MIYLDLRQKFLDFFIKNGHKEQMPASLIPEDPSTLFTTAGMQQFKPYYLEPNQSPDSRIVTIQPCFRTSDIDEVGDDTHLTFFEMMGNFSFGYPTLSRGASAKCGLPYFKKEAIDFAWRFLTDELKIDISRLQATYFKGTELVSEDSESKQILEQYREKGLNNIIGQGFEDNFWSLGTEGSPGGPTVEFYIDGIEVWNLVFNEFVFKKGKYIPSQYKGVDTGSGLERVLTVINGAKSVFETELFSSAYELINCAKQKDDIKAERIILDHIKSATFLIADGVVPSNKEQGYVLRRLIRRSVVKAEQIGLQRGFVSELAKEYINYYKSIYQKLKEDIIIPEIEKEEEKFRKTLKQGIREFEKIKDSIDGNKAFDLYQTYGFPWEMIIELAEESGIKVDKSEFEKAFKSHQEISRAGAGIFKGGLAGTGEMETKYHTATHLLHTALRKVLGEYVQQKGSNITAERLRFDFTNSEKLSPEQIKQVEDLVNEQIEKDLPVILEEMSPEGAKKSGALGFFEHKYGDKVKVYTIGQSAFDYFSKEICGGPHVAHTGELGRFKIQKEESSSSNVRRIKAVLS